MKPIIQQLLKMAETGEKDYKLSALMDIFDYIYHPYPHEDGYVEVVQQMIVLLSKENDPEVRKLLVRNIERAYMYTINLEEISFEPLTSILDKADPFFIRSVLYLLSMTYNRKYIPVVEKYLSHSDEEVRKEVKYILDTW
jgi:hypothetical protein